AINSHFEGVDARRMRAGTGRLAISLTLQSTWDLRGEKKWMVGMELANLRDLYVAELQELLSAQKQLAEPLARVAEVVSHPALNKALNGHGEETLVQQQRIATILTNHAAGTNEHVDQAMRALVGEVGKMAAMLRGQELRDAGLIGSLQRLEHYEIAAYGTA